jgi:hypothetical protein
VLLAGTDNHSIAGVNLGRNSDFDFLAVQIVDLLVPHCLQLVAVEVVALHYYCSRRIGLIHDYSGYPTNFPCCWAFPTLGLQAEVVRGELPDVCHLNFPKVGVCETITVLGSLARWDFDALHPAGSTNFVDALPLLPGASLIASRGYPTNLIDP